MKTMRTTTRSRAALMAIATATAAACGGQVGEEGGVVCQAVTTTPLGLDDPTPLGFSAGELLDATMGDHGAAVAWITGAETDMAIALSYVDGSAEFQERDWVGGEGSLELAASGCPDVIQLSARVDVATADGALDESWEVVALADSASRLSFTRVLEELSGSLSIEDFAPDGDWTGIRAWVDLAIGADGVTGKLSGQVSGEDGEVAFAEGFDIAVIGELDP
jgi:hypothetical protein